MSKLRIGVIGCGAIAQVQHLPNLRELSDEFEIAGLCDTSRGLLASVGHEFGVEASRRFMDYGDLFKAGLDGVIVCSSGSHAPPCVAAAEAGVNVLVEKPMCANVREAKAMVEAGERNRVVMMVGYMKRHEPAYKYARERVAAMADVRFIQVNHLHPDNSLHTREFRYQRATDLPASARAAVDADLDRLIAEELGLGVLPGHIRAAYFQVLGSLIHDIGNLTGMFGPPRRVLSTEIWLNGRGITSTLDYGGDLRAVLTWVDLPELWDFKETLEIYGSRERVIVSFPTGFSRGLPTHVTVQSMDPKGLPQRQELSWHENPFAIELRHFGECIRSGKPPETPAADAVADIKLVGDIIRAYLSAGGR